MSRQGHVSREAQVSCMPRAHGPGRPGLTAIALHATAARRTPSASSPRICLICVSGHPRLPAARRLLVPHLSGRVCLPGPGGRGSGLAGGGCRRPSGTGRRGARRIHMPSSSPAVAMDTSRFWTRPPAMSPRSDREQSLSRGSTPPSRARNGSRAAGPRAAVGAPDVTGRHYPRAIARIVLSPASAGMFTLQTTFSASADGIYRRNCASAQAGATRTTRSTR